MTQMTPTEDEVESAGQTTVQAADSIEVSQFVAQPPDAVWKRLTQREGIEALLGSGAMLGGKGEPWHAQDGTHGVVRSYHPGEQVRVSWHADADAPATLVDLQTFRDGDGTRIQLSHQHLDGSVDRDRLRRRWEGALRDLVGS
ncbi:MAG TPA: SRPBCC domain-containing protein [Segeticoccus sp.]|uniref:SRPBCC family protein n=1 Tax=Segeticoccus sp. TaxID=2706531 RepID=UPI002D7E4A26|nr:SRPBCC domain-containing protein [Segeticoccus sp.]HET8600678.1 SRPBCC domain-containing protein [Segeticoccus sp.]